MNILRTIACFLLFLCYMIEAHAATKDSRTVVHSDTLVVKERENTAVFVGNVISKQQTNTLKSGKMIVFYHPKANHGDDKGSIRRIEVYEGVEITTNKERATSDWGYYEDDVFYLLGNVKMYSGKNIMTGEKFIHNNKTGKSGLVGGDNQSSGKPSKKSKLILQPSEDAS